MTAMPICEYYDGAIPLQSVRQTDFVPFRNDDPDRFCCLLIARV